MCCCNAVGVPSQTVYKLTNHLSFLRRVSCCLLIKSLRSTVRAPGFYICRADVQCIRCA